MENNWFRTRPMRKDGERSNRRGRVVAGVAIMLVSSFGWRMWQGASDSALLISIEEVGEACERPVHADSPVRAASENLFAAFEPESVYAQDTRTQDVTRPPLRYIRDSDPIYSYVALDPRRNEVVMLDSNLWSIRFFDRLE